MFYLNYIWTVKRSIWKWKSDIVYKIKHTNFNCKHICSWTVKWSIWKCKSDSVYKMTFAFWCLMHYFDYTHHEGVAKVCLVCFKFAFWYASIHMNHDVDHTRNEGVEKVCFVYFKFAFSCVSMIIIHCFDFIHNQGAEKVCLFWICIFMYFKKHNSLFQL